MSTQKFESSAPLESSGSKIDQQYAEAIGGTASVHKPSLASGKGKEEGLFEEVGGKDVLAQGERREGLTLPRETTSTTTSTSTLPAEHREHKEGFFDKIGNLFVRRPLFNPFIINDTLQLRSLTFLPRMSLQLFFLSQSFCFFIISSL